MKQRLSRWIGGHDATLRVAGDDRQRQAVEQQLNPLREHGLLSGGSDRALEKRLSACWRCWEGGSHGGILEKPGALDHDLDQVPRG
jgi:hypothetical protein